MREVSFGRERSAMNKQTNTKPPAEALSARADTSKATPKTSPEWMLPPCLSLGRLSRPRIINATVSTHCLWKKSIGSPALAPIQGLWRIVGGFLPVGPPQCPAPVAYDSLATFGRKRTQSLPVKTNVSSTISRARFSCQHRSMCVDRSRSCKWNTFLYVFGSHISIVRGKNVKGIF